MTTCPKAEACFSLAAGEATSVVIIVVLNSVGGLGKSWVSVGKLESRELKPDQALLWRLGEGAAELEATGLPDVPGDGDR